MKRYCSLLLFAAAQVVCTKPALAQQVEITGYSAASCTTTAVHKTSLSLSGWLDDSSRVKSNFSVGPSPIANVSCSTQAVVGVKKTAGKLALSGASSCDYNGSGNGSANCVRYTASVDWAAAVATSPPEDDSPGSGHNSSTYGIGTGNYTARITITPSKDVANPTLSVGTYSDIIIIQVGNSL